MKHYEDEQEREKEANAIDALSEDFPEEPLPNKNLPELTKLEPGDQKDISTGVEKALEQMDEYMKDTPKRGKHS